MKEALKEAKKSLLENEFPVGCVITLNNIIIARGRRKKSRGKNPSEIDHAEINAIKLLNDQNPQMPKKDMVLYSTMEPCMMCFSAIMLCNFKKIVYAYEDVMGGGLSMLSFEALPVFYRERTPVIISDILREESLELFKKFFSNPDNIYWKDSPLAKYTLSF